MSAAARERRNQMLALARTWDERAQQMRIEWAGDSSALAMLASGHKEANLLAQCAGELRAALDRSGDEDAADVCKPCGCLSFGEDCDECRTDPVSAPSKGGSDAR